MRAFTYQDRWKLILFVFGVGIIFFSLWYTHILADEIAREEIQKANELASAYKTLNSTESDESELTDALETIKSNNNIPVIWANSNNEILGYKNFDSLKIRTGQQYLEYELKKLKKSKQFVIIDVAGAEKQYLYYEDSDLLKKIKKYPFYQLMLVALFFIISYAAFSATRRAQQNQVWVGLAKETAHQLGTPLSSLSAWIEMLRDKLTDEEGKMMIDEMEKDIDRLDLVTKRFSKIGSPPELQPTFLLDVIYHCVDYMSKRAAHNIQLQVKDATDGLCKVNINAQLFEWVLENLMKNSLDAMEGKGKIEIIVFEKDGVVTIDLKDTGKGIPKNQFEEIFEPGFSTKKRGWGLGLTLSKRIIEEYHFGKIFVKDSVLGKGTTFRIMLKSAA